MDGHCKKHRSTRVRDRRKEYERRVDETLNELHDKGFTKERAGEYQRRQTLWWRECDKWNMNGFN